LSVRSIPTMDRATWCRTPAAASAARRFRPDVSKNSSTALSSNEGELARSITTCAPAMASLSPSPVMVLTPVFGAAAIASCPFCFSFSTTFDPIKPVPPITTIFMTSPLMMVSRQRRHPSCSPPDRVQGRIRRMEQSDLAASCRRRRMHRKRPGRRGSHCLRKKKPNGSAIVASAAKSAAALRERRPRA